MGEAIDRFNGDHFVAGDLCDLCHECLGRMLGFVADPEDVDCVHTFRCGDGGVRADGEEGGFRAMASFCGYDGVKQSVCFGVKCFFEIRTDEGPGWILDCCSFAVELLLAVVLDSLFEEILLNEE